MGYNVYYKGDKCKAYNGNIPYNVFHYTKQRHIWPDDTTTISLSYDLAHDFIYYTISNLSNRAQYLYDNDLLGIGLFVDERHVYMGKNMMSETTKLNHPHRRCMGFRECTSLNGFFNLNLEDFRMSDALDQYFDMQAQYEADPAYSGTDNYYIGIGRYSSQDCGFRIFNISEGITLTRYNPY